MTRIAVGVALLLVISCGPAPPPITTNTSATTLLVVISVDQMRADYIDRFQHQWTKGLNRLVTRGAWFQQAAYPYLNTVTCAGHATIATGAVPATHGMIQNEWWDREAGHMVKCTDDSAAMPVSYGAPVEDGHSAARLRVSTLPDAMRTRLRPTSRVVTVSLKARAAIMLAGHGADAVTWFDEDAGVWVTSSVYSRRPVPFLVNLFEKYPFRVDFGKVWAGALPKGQYLYDDTSVGKRPLKPWGSSLPHELTGSGAPGESFYEQWAGSPFSDAYLARMAIAGVEGLHLGSGPGTDYLGIGFSALDHVGHDFGPMSHEVQDVLVHLDGTLGVLLDSLDRTVGAQRYVVALTADHGVAPIPEQLQAGGIDAGRLDTRRLREQLNDLLVGRYGPGAYVSHLDHTDLYFAPGVYSRISNDRQTLGGVTKLIESQAGVSRVFRGEELAQLAADGDAAAKAALLSYFPSRSGDMILIPKFNWIAADDSAATHGTQYDYDARVPIILMGPPFRPGRYHEAASPADIAPTLGSLVGIKLPNATGRVLAEAVQAVQGSGGKVRAELATLETLNAEP